MNGRVSLTCRLRRRLGHDSAVGADDDSGTRERRMRSAGLRTRLIDGGGRCVVKQIVGSGGRVWVDLGWVGEGMKKSWGVWCFLQKRFLTVTRRAVARYMEGFQETKN